MWPGFAESYQGTAGCQQDIKIAKLLHSVNVGQTLLYGSQMWGYRNLKSIEPMKHPMQPTYSVIPRQAMRQPAHTAHWIVSMHMGLMPIQYWIMRSFIRWWNKLLSVRENNAVLNNCIQAQVELLASRKACWLGKWDAAFKRVLPHYLIGDFLRNALPVDEAACMQAISTSYHNMLKNMGDPRDPSCSHRRIAVAYSMHMHDLGVLPTYHTWRIRDSIMATWVQFVCTNTDLPVHTLQDCVDYSQRKCCKCTQAAVADEHHVLLECSSTQRTRDLHSVRVSFQVANLGEFLSKNTDDQIANYVYAALAAYRS